MHGLVAHLSPDRRAQIRRLGAIPISRSLNALAAWYGTDKRDHGYMPLYQHHFAPMRRRTRTVVEIGVGGESVAHAGGPSLRMWRTFFPNATIIGVDIAQKRLPREARVTILQGDQSDLGFLRQLGARHGPFDVVIDDGSHRGEDINIAFDALWPHVSSDGFYVIEDLETAYDSEGYGGGPPGTPGTSLSLLKRLLDSTQGTTPPEGVAAVHVYTNIALIRKR